MEALDCLDANFPDTHQMVFGAESGEARLYRQARAIYGRLEAVNCELYQSIRYEIQQGARPDTLLQWVHPSTSIADVVGLAHGIGYDYLDELIIGVLQFEEPHAGHVQRSSEMVFYQPTPARHIFSLIGITALTATDVLVDLGSGLGTRSVTGLHLYERPQHRDRAGGGLCRVRPAKRTGAKLEEGYVHPTGCACRGFIQRDGFLSVHALYGVHSERGAQPAQAGSRQPPNPNLHIWPMYDCHR
jgi:hypothetical protein